ncbi:Alkaline phosphatase [Ceratocystis lukuohia]|uniref:alkaline phosphatase n=1 Tax=Ceratocystis lukuohia TaxID=2019550 RepID=A0ABR4MLG1_9PEZI
MAKLTSKSIVNVASKIYHRIHIKGPGDDRKAKNVILFIGDVNRKYQSHMAMNLFPTLGHQITHSIDTTMTDSANLASALYNGHKGSARSMGVYPDSSPDQFDDLKVETIAELVTRILGMHWGAATTANLNGATPAALVSHTCSRSNYGPIIDYILNGITKYTGNEYVGPEVFLVLKDAGV